MSDKTPKTCFVIAPIDEPESEVRTRSDQILKHVIRPAVGECGYSNPVRADEIDEPGNITSQVIQHVTEDDLVVADLTDKNPNVFYELAIRHAIRRPFVQIAKAGERIPFDVYGQRTIFIDHTNLDNFASAIASIVEQIKSFEAKDAQVETPISMSLDLQHLRQSENPEQRSLADILSELSSIRNTLSDMDIQRLEGHLVRMQEELSISRRRRHRHEGPPPGMVIDMMRSRSGRGTYAFPVALSFVREEVPWVYEVGMEMHRQQMTGDRPKAQRLATELMELIEITSDLPHMGGNSQEAMNHVRDMVRQVATGEL